MNKVLLFSESGIVEARLYRKGGTYFRGNGRSDAEAIGSLVCHCPEQFNCRFEIVADEEEATIKGNE